MRPEHAARTREGLVAVLPGLWREGDAATFATTALDGPGVPAVVHSLDDLLAQVDTIRSVGRSPASRHDPFADCFGPLSDDPLGGGVTRGTLEPVERILATLPATGRRTVVLLLTDGIVDARCPSARYSAEERLRRLADYATRRNAVIYGLMTTPFSSGVKMPEHRGPTADAARRPPMSVRPESVVRGYLRTIAERTGGFAVRSNDIGEMVTRAVGDQDGYYVLTYEPPEGTFTTEAGRHAYRRLRVRCSRNDVTCRGRSGFYSIADDRPSGTR
jgi:VWFA-related protein